MSAEEFHISKLKELGYKDEYINQIVERFRKNVNYSFAQEYANQENLELIRFFKQYPGMTKHLTPEFILSQFRESKTNKEQTKDGNKGN